MSQVQHKPMTGAEFLAWEAVQELKWEFDGEQPVAMVGVTDAHGAIQVNLLVSLRSRLRGTRCYVRGPEIKVEAGASYCYPDAFVSCTPVASTSTTAAEPVVIFEILSPGTADTDRTVKLAEYLGLSSVQRYVMLEQNRAFATVVSRTDAGWALTLAGPNGTLAMPEISVEVPMVELYDGVEVSP